MPSYSPSPDLCISCVHVIKDGKPVNCVSKSGGDWVLLCSPDCSAIEEETDKSLFTVHHRHLSDKDRTISEIMKKLRDNYTAERENINKIWKIYFDLDE